MNSHLTLIFSVLVLVFAAAACSDSDEMKKEEMKETKEMEKPEWGYEESNGPDVWHTLSTKYEICKTGMRQSPIDIVNPVQATLPSVTFDYKDAPINVQNNGHTIQFDYEAGSSITIGDAKYNLVQFHFHSPSENTVDGTQYDLEIHFVHANAAKEFAVVGLFVRSGSMNEALAPVWDNMPSKAKETNMPAGKSYNAKSLLPDAKVFYRFDGSLTTPPCSQGVKWLVLTTPIEASAKQISAFRAIFHKNNRPVQPLNGRTLQVDALPSGS